MSADAPGATPEAATLTLADDPDAWALAGFTVDPDGTCRLGGVRLVLAGPDAGRGVTAWAIRGLPPEAAPDLDGLPTHATAEGPVDPACHPSSAVAVDHIVLLTDDIDRTVAAAAGVGLAPRRWRDHATPEGTPVRQVFYRVGEVVLEVVAPRDRPARPRPGVRSFGLALVATDISAARSVLGDGLGPERPAVQAGRSIATVRHRALGLRTPVALMSPRPPRRPTPPQPPTPNW
ncbi:hypothetical protein [Iamia sp.]|uniref:hypothetical protein n=1 Tax=Iamia sp. TaxID=2722710 RepID=UPI002CBC31B5|nr:hypothetical protein [Iamia sp.]HXH58701.1 hypothetical protein [Iamia sp.]